MNVDALTAFVGGVAIPLVVALLGKERLGQWLMSGATREDTALGTLTELVKESVSGWRESNSAYVRLAESVQNVESGLGAGITDVRDRIVRQDARFDRLEERLSTLVKVLGDGR